MDPNPFVRAFQLKKVDEQWHRNVTESWENLKNDYVGSGEMLTYRSGVRSDLCRPKRGL